MQDFNVCQPRELIYGITIKFKAYPTLSKPTYLQNNNLAKIWPNARWMNIQVGTVYILSGIILTSF